MFARLIVKIKMSFKVAMLMGVFLTFQHLTGFMPGSKGDFIGLIAGVLGSFVFVFLLTLIKHPEQ